MTTAFQPDLFQSNAFQIAGGVTATEFEATISFTQDSDGLSVTLGLPSGGVPGRVHNYVALINGRRVYGTYWDILRAVQDFAEEEAERQAALSLEKPRRVRIVVQPGKEIPATAQNTGQTSSALPESAAKEIQQKVRDLYQTAYVKAKQQIEDDEEEAFALML
jgi:hypothetical protein